MNQLRWQEFADRSLSGEKLFRTEALEILRCPDDKILDLLSAAFRIREKYFGKRVKLNYLVNAKSGLCPEDCHYCSQSKVSQAPIDKYTLMSTEDILRQAEHAIQVKAKRVCLVTSGRGPKDSEVEGMAQTVKEIKNRYPHLEICCCMGLLTKSQGRRLVEAGVYAYNHNLNTSEDFYSKICSTHTYEDRLDTIKSVQSAGLSSCSGALFGMGESDKDILDAAFALKEVQPDSIPINFLIPVEGTPLEGKVTLTPHRCLKILCLFRFLLPSSEIRISGGREHHLGWLQPLGLYAANSIFIGDYLTTKGQSAKDDLRMIAELGFEVEGAETPQRSFKVEIAHRA